MRRRKVLRRGWFGDTVSYAYLTILAAIAAFPLFWILLLLYQEQGRADQEPYRYFPKEISFENFQIVFDS